MEKLYYKKNSLIKFFGLIILSIFFVEFILMYLLEININLSYFMKSLIDSSLLAIIISPVLYFFSFRFLVKEVKNHQEAEKRYKGLFDNLQDAVMTLNPPDWKFTNGNEATLKMFGLKDEDELRSSNPGDLSPQYQLDGSLSSEKFKEMIAVAMERGRNFFDWTHKKKNGSEFLASVSLVRIKIDGDTFLQAVVRDVTEQRKAMELADKSRNELKKALVESERANKLMVGRELEMVKLKKEIQELKNNK